jgi:hypothetical protein
MNLDLQSIQTETFWKALCPKLSISNQPLAELSDWGQSRPLDEETWTTCKQTIADDGYFAYQGWFDDGQIERMAKCFEELDAKGIHPVFAFVYDEFWDLLMQLDPLLSDLLDDYECLPAVWSWFVRPNNQSAFAPHRDQVRELDIDDEEHLDYLTIWVPLTDLDHLSSAICVLPASLDPNYERCTAEIEVENLQDVRSLQGKRGSVFCWTTQLAHWGTRQSSHGPPRMSVGYYLKRTEAENLEEEAPVDFASPLSLRQRLSIIGQQIKNYSRSASAEELEFAEQLIGLSD